MGAAEAGAAILSAAVALLVALASLMWWAYKRGEAAGEARAERRAGERSLAEDKAKIEALERRLGEVLAQLASRQPKRRRALRPAPGDGQAGEEGPAGDCHPGRAGRWHPVAEQPGPVQRRPRACLAKHRCTWADYTVCRSPS